MLAESILRLTLKGLGGCTLLGSASGRLKCQVGAKGRSPGWIFSFSLGSSKATSKECYEVEVIAWKD